MHLMNDLKVTQHSIELLIGGFVFLGLSIYILLIFGYRNATRQCGAVSKRQAESFRRNDSKMWIFGLVFAFFAVGLARQGLAKIERQQEHGISDLIAGLVGVVIATYQIFHRKKLASSSADWQEFYAEFILRNSWLLLIVGILSGLCGIAMICAVLAKLL